MVNMKDIAVCYDKISAFDMLVDIAKVAGVESIQAALDEIAAQHRVQRTGLESPQYDICGHGVVPAKDCYICFPPRH